MLITIGITCFNAEKTIKRALDSALAQTWSPIEIIVVDDCSTDDSARIIKQIVNHQINIKFIQQQENQGASAARNTIIEIASGDYIAFFDDDDESLENRILEQFLEIQKYSETMDTHEPILCFASGLRHYQNGHIKDLNAIGSNGHPIIGERIAEYLLFNRRYPGYFYGTGTPSCSLMIKTADIKKLGSFDEDLRRVEDVDLAIRASLAKSIFIGTKKKLFIQYSTEGPHKTAKINFDYELKIIHKNKKFLKEKNRYLYSCLWTRIRFLHFQKRHFAFFFLLLFFLMCFPLSGSYHALRSLPQRLIHELKIR